MAESEAAEGVQDLEAPEEEEDLTDERQALMHFGKYHEARHSLPWEQWTFKEKANFYMDRTFLWLLVVFLLMLLGECGFKMWYVTNVNKIMEFVSDLVVFLSDWLFSQQKQEELFEL